MTDFELIQNAIQNRYSIEFEYNIQGKIYGKRVGNPHALYLFKSVNSDEETTKLDIFQTSGVTDTPEKPFPKWMGPLTVKNIQQVRILSEKGQFQIAPGYNPNSERYKFVIEQV